MLCIKRLGPVICMLIVALFTASCSSGEVRIGLMLDLSGRSSALGVAARNGAELAIEAVNKDGGINGKKVVLVIRDDEGSAEKAIAVDKALMNENIVLGIGHLASGTGIAGLPVFNEYQKIMLSPTISTTSLSGLDDMFFRVIGTTAQQGVLLANDALLFTENKKAAILFEANNKAYSEDVAVYFQKRFEEGGGTIVFRSDYISQQPIDFTGIASSMVESGADTFLIVASGADLGVLTQKIRASYPDAHIYSGMWGMTKDMINKSGPAGDGVRFPSVFDLSSQRPAFISFRQDYLQTFSLEPEFASLCAYDSIMLAAKALRNAADFKTETIKKAILENSPYDGLQVSFSIDAYGDVVRDYWLFELDNGRFVRVN